jgi:hypothetical protein
MVQTTLPRLHRRTDDLAGLEELARQILSAA